MSGREEYEYKIDLKISHLIEKNGNKDYLIGFRYFIDDMAITSVYNYVSRVNNFMDYTKKIPQELSIDDYSIYLGMLKREGKTSSFRIMTYTALKKFSSYLFAKRINIDDPMQYVKRPKAKEKAETIKRRENGFLNISELKELNNNVRNGVGTKKARSFQEETKERDKAIIDIFLNTGMRCSALCNLDIFDINENKKSICVTDKGNKIIEYRITNDIWATIKKWLQKRSYIKTDSDALFIKQNGERIGYQGVYKLIKKYSCSIEGKNITPHKLRATYGTQLYNATKDIHFVQKCMNHNSPQTTSLYIRGEENTSKEASEIMSKLISG